jgi:hypothetical protein
MSLTKEDFINERIYHTKNCHHCGEYLETVGYEFGVQIYGWNGPGGTLCNSCVAELRRQRACMKCGLILDSGNLLFAHLKRENHYMDKRDFYLFGNKSK